MSVLSSGALPSLSASFANHQDTTLSKSLSNPAVRSVQTPKETDSNDGKIMRDNQSMIAKSLFVRDPFFSDLEKIQRVAVKVIFARDMQAWFQAKTQRKIEKEEAKSLDNYHRHVSEKDSVRMGHNAQKDKLKSGHKSQPQLTHLCESAAAKNKGKEKENQICEKLNEKIKCMASLTKLSIPLSKRELSRLLDWIEGLQKKLRETQTMDYPCQFSDGVCTIEAHSPEEIYLLFPNSSVEEPEKCIAITNYKKIYYTWLMTNPVKRFVYAVTECDSQSRNRAADNEETYLMKFNEHPHSVRVHKLFYYKNQQILIMKDYKRRDLFKTLRALLSKTNKVAISDYQKLQYAEDILLILRDLHQNNLAHRDIKPENILETSRSRLALTDYGFTTQMSTKEMLRDVGSMAYMGHEFFNQTYVGNGIALDIWALGCVFYMLFAERTVPWFAFLVPRKEKKVRVKEALIRMEHFNWLSPSESSQPLFYIVRQMLDIDPDKRPQLEEVLNFIQRYKKNFYGCKPSETIAQQFANRPKVQSLEKSTIERLGV